MKALKIGFIMFFCLVSHMNCTEDEDTLSILEQMENTQFGKNLLDTIELQLSATDSIDNVLKLLQDMEQRLVDTQHEDDAMNKEFQEECYDTVARLTSEIKEADYKIEYIQEELDEKVPRRNRRQETLKEKEGEKVEVQETIIEEYKVKQVKDEEWDQTQEDHSRATYVIQTAKDVLQGSLVSFVQTGTNVMNQLSEHFSSSAKKIQFHKTKSWNQIFHIFAEITSATPVQADQGQVKKIIELIDNLLQKISQSLDLERRQYTNFVDEYNRKMDALTARLNKLDSEITDLTNEINVLNKRINMILQEQREQKERSKQKSSEKNDKEQTCDDEGNDYMERRERRDQEKLTVSQTIGLINQKLRILKKYIADRKHKF